MVELSHDGCLGEEIASGLFAGAGLEGFDGHVDFLHEIWRNLEAAPANVAKLAATCKGFIE